MKTPKFTAPPWKIVDECFIVDSKGFMIAATRQRADGEEDANSVLLHAAPEMYELLEYWLYEAHRGMRYHFRRWINAGLDRESLLNSETTQKFIAKIRETKLLLKRIREAGQ